MISAKDYITRVIRPPKNRLVQRKELEAKVKELQERRGVVDERIGEAERARDEAVREASNVDPDAPPDAFAESIAGIQARIDATSRQVASLQKARKRLERDIALAQRTLVPLVDADLKGRQAAHLAKAEEAHRRIAVHRKRLDEAEREMEAEVSKAQRIYANRRERLLTVYRSSPDRPHLNKAGGQILGPEPQSPRLRYPRNSTF